MTLMTREQVYKEQKEAMALKIRKILLEDEFYVGSPLAISLKIADALLQGKDECPERKIREFIWYRHGCPSHALYGDDGELQCSICVIDFKRQPIIEILNKLEWNNLKRNGTGLKTPEQKCPLCGDNWHRGECKPKPQTPEHCEIMKMPHYGLDLANKNYKVIIQEVWDKLNELVMAVNKLSGKDI